MKATFKCEESKKWIYRNYPNFPKNDFQSDLLLNMEMERIITSNLWIYFEGIIHKPHFDKILKKAIMKRS